MFVYDNGAHLIKDSNGDFLSQMSKLCLLLILQNISSACIVTIWTSCRASNQNVKTSQMQTMVYCVAVWQLCTLYSICIQHIIICIPLWFIQQLIWRAFAIRFGTFDAICSYYFYDILVMHCIHVYLYEHIQNDGIYRVSHNSWTIFHLRVQDIKTSLLVCFFQQKKFGAEKCFSNFNSLQQIRIFQNYPVSGAALERYWPLLKG